ncbi:hypothetical protein [Saccharothrix longispora]|uniref:hypothetical protein n=1 Tax=Saccharothrix longispora TaxID=33920 RepID=UPI0028FD04AD|nr:hypothetical protein [Saccharothrix longispora]MDU0287854.1 hypothetical protein [Saccharothrix longispora]
MSSTLRAVALTLAVLAAPLVAAAPASADPGICIDHVMEQGVEATDAVLYACKIAKSGLPGDVRRCRSILQAEGVPPGEARHACRIASYPED